MMNEMTNEMTSCVAGIARGGAAAVGGRALHTCRMANWAAAAVRRWDRTR